MATEAERAAWKAAMADKTNRGWAWDNLKPWLKEYPEIVARLNAHVAQVMGLASVKALADDSAPDEQVTTVLKECLMAARRYRAYKLNPEQMAKLDGKPWDSGLKGEAPKGSVDTSTATADELIDIEASELDGLVESSTVAPVDDAAAAMALLSKALSKPSGPDEKRVSELISKATRPLQDASINIKQDVMKVAECNTKLSAAMEGVVKNMEDTAKLTAGVGNKLADVCVSILKLEERAKIPLVEVPKESVEAALKTSVIEILGEVMKTGGLSTAPKEAEKEAEQDGMYRPEKDTTYLVRGGMVKFFKQMHDNSTKGKIQNVALVGPHGCGKTELAMWYAAEYKKSMLIMDCPNIREPRDWFGYRTLHDGRTGWKRSQFDKAMSEGGNVILLDELPRAIPMILNTLFPLLDRRRFTYIEERGSRLQVGPGTVIFCSMNEGYQYTGNMAVDAALSDRFTRRLEVDYLKPSEEAKVLRTRTGIDPDVADKLADLAATIRKKAVGNGATLTKTISTRQLVEAAEDFVSLGVEALKYNITNHYSAEGGETGERAQVLQMVQGKFGSLCGKSSLMGLIVNSTATP